MIIARNRQSIPLNIQMTCKMHIINKITNLILKLSKILKIKFLSQMMINNKIKINLHNKMK